MGYNNTGTTTTLTAKFTPIGRKKIITGNNNLITSFSLGDSDANYFATLPLTTGEVPTAGGSVGTYDSITNSVGPNVRIKSMLLVDGTSTTKKAVELQSSAITTDYIFNGTEIISGSNITQSIVNRNNLNTDSLVNLFYSFNLPLDSTDVYKFTGLTSSFGGYSNTALSGLAYNNILVIALNNSSYGEIIDGKTIKLQLTTLVTGYTIYSTFQNTGTQTSVQDVNYTDKATNTLFLGDNIAFLFSDGINKPNSDSSLSWATGYGTVKPFSLNSKQQYNLVTDTNVNQNADTLVGVAYLDKGFLVITHPTIVNWFDVTSTATTVTLNSVSSNVTQNITCIANRGEFGSSNNTTFRYSDIPRISEVGLYDTDGDLIAIAKTDRHLLKNINEFLALGVKINI